MKRPRLTIIEMLVLIAVLGVLGAIVIPVVARAQQTASRSTCLMNLKQLGAALTAYARENRGLYPPVQGDPSFGTASKAAHCDPSSTHDEAVLAPDTARLFPEYLTDPEILLCPSDPNAGAENPLRIAQDDGSGLCEYAGRITNGGESYMYIGYLLDRVEEHRSHPGNHPTPHPSQLLLAARAFASVLSNGNPADDALLDGDLDLRPFREEAGAPEDPACETLYRLRDGLIQWLMQRDELVYDGSTMVRYPVIWDRPALGDSHALQYNHTPFGYNVLYLDGHVDFTRYAGQFPATGEFEYFARRFP